jgi:hypothetical protein
MLTGRLTALLNPWLNLKNIFGLEVTADPLLGPDNLLVA